MSSSDDASETQTNNQNFRIDARHLELTYSRCNATVEDFTEFLNTSILKKTQCHSWFAAREYHQDGTPHYHVLVKFNKRQSFRDPRAFDHAGYHPRIRSVRDVHAYFRYITDPSKPSRDTTFSSADWMDPIARANTGGRRRTGNGPDNDGLDGEGVSWRDIVDAETKVEYFELVRKYKPYDYALNLARLEFSASRLFNRKPVYVPEFKYTDFNVPEELAEWATVHRHEPHRPKSLILCGPTRTGKTEWARSIGRHTYWYGQCNIDTWDDAMEYLIMDDFGVEVTKYLPLWKGYFGAQKELNVTQKYRGVYPKSYGKPLLWLCNQLPIFSPSEQDWVDSNCITVIIRSALFE